MRLLIAEDEQELLRPISAILTRQGYEVTTAADGLEVLEKATEGTYDCMIFDIMMPRMDGIEALKKIRERVECPGQCRWCENLWLEVTSQGLGTVMLGIAPHEDCMAPVVKALDIPAGLKPIAIFPVGYPAETRDQQDRYDTARIHYV